MNYASDIKSSQASGYAIAPPPQQQSEMAEQALRLHGSLDGLTSLLQQLGERLQPLIRPIPVAGSTAKPEAVRSLSPLAEQVCNATGRIEDLSYRVRSVLDSLAV